MLLSALLPAGTAVAEPELVAAALPGDLTELTLADLMNIEITSVSKRPEPAFEAAAAVFVLTGEEIRRAGARSIPEALRLVPGLHVARIGDINTHAVSSRGFADRLSDKLEVLIDGRTVYTPLFSGVFWATLDTFLPDIERIEVIRGPGAALWGTNAINGVINIVTKPASETTGQLFHAGAGTEERSFAALRGGTAVGTLGHARIYAKHTERDALKFSDGRDTFNDARLRQAGFRGEFTTAPGHRLLLSGDAYSGEREDIFVAPPETGLVQNSGGNLLARWTWQAAAGSELSVQTYYDQSRRFIPDNVFREERKIGDLSVDHRLVLGERHTLVYGAGYRHSRDVTAEPPFVFLFVPPRETLHYYTAFVQDQIRLWDRGELTLGTKYEHNDYTGAELQPSVRLGWRLSDDWFGWAAVSRAVRTPSRLDTGLATFDPSLRNGNPDQQTEKLIAYEWGLRLFAGERWGARLATFYNAYDDLRSSEAAVPVPRFGNGLKGHGRGGELSLDWRAHEALELRLSYSYLHLNLHSKPGSTDAGTARAIEGNSPEHQAGLRVSWQPRDRFSVDGFLRYVGTLSPPNGAVSAYTELNLRTAWRPRQDLEIALVGENLLDGRHAEFRTPVSYTEVERSGLLELTWAWD